MVRLHAQLVNSTVRRVIKRLHLPLEIMLVRVRWYAADPLSLRNPEEIMAGLIGPARRGDLAAGSGYCSCTGAACPRC